MKRKSIVVHISKKHKETLMIVKKKTGIPIKFVVEKAVEKYLELNHPEVFKNLMEKYNERVQN